MKRLFALLGLIGILLCGCTSKTAPTDIAATTLPVYEFTARLCEGTGLQVGLVVSDSVSCLHDYTLSVRQVKMLEQAQLVVCSGAGLEDFMADLLEDKVCLDASAGISLLESCHDHEDDHGHEHHHEADPHIWLSPEHAAVMAENIFQGLLARYPGHEVILRQNLQQLLSDIAAVSEYGRSQLSGLSQQQIITFHDGFSYLAACYGLEILQAIEEESGSEASAAELKELIGIVRTHEMRAIFTETNGSASAAQIIAAETGAKVYCLDMAMSGKSWFDAMYHNIDTLKEALG